MTTTVHVVATYDNKTKALKIGVYTKRSMVDDLILELEPEYVYETGERYPQVTKPQLVEFVLNRLKAKGTTVYVTDLTIDRFTLPTASIAMGGQRYEVMWSDKSNAIEDLEPMVPPMRFNTQQEAERFSILAEKNSDKIWSVVDLVDLVDFYQEVL